MKTTIMSIPQCAATDTLKKLGEKQIACEYMGIDSSGRIVMQIAFEENLQDLINELTRSMEESEKAMIQLFKVVDIALQNAILEQLSRKSFRSFRKQINKDQIK
jgi:hypothetical protein